ncbi:MAG: hypothetical protein EBT07_01625 [Actinobacteria bacterium]|jgi:bacterioferritin (cytochrome b1)|nr:hypothetical protein [Actinomycetota bacterium]
MARVKEVEPRNASTDDLINEAREYAFVKKQIDYLEKQQKELREKLFSRLDETGEPDSSGNIFIELPQEVEGFRTVQKQRRVTRKVDEGVAERIIAEKGMEDTLYKTVRMIDEDALMAALYSEQLTEEEVDEMYPQKIVWALVMGKK